VVFGAILVVAAYVLPRSELLYIGVLLIALPLSALVFVRFRRHRMSVARRFSPAVAHAGVPLSVAVEVRNLAAQRTGEATWRDEWPWFPFGTEVKRLAPLARNRGTLGASSSIVVDYVLNPPRRGIFEVGPLVVEVSDPFRLARSEIVVGGFHKLVVTPRAVELPVTGQSVAADDGSARARLRRNTSADDELTTREYRQGDPLRRIHWKATARHGELMVRLEEQRSHAQACILVETRRAGYRDAVAPTVDQPESDSFEWVVAFTASLAIHLRELGFSVDIAETGYRQVASPEHEDDFLESLAAVELVQGAATSRLLPGSPDPGQSRGSIFALIADAEARTLDRLVSQRGQFDTAIAFIVNPHNDVVTGALRDAGWVCVAVGPTDDFSEAWLTAAGTGSGRVGA
jgi:uncharacterized protein (DUF58 family)